MTIRLGPWSATSPINATNSGERSSVPADARKALMAAGVPRSFFGRRYLALPERVLVEDPGGRS